MNFKLLAITISSCALLFASGCSEQKKYENAQDAQRSQTVKNLTSKNKKDEVFVVGKDPENLRTQKVGETVLNDWQSPDGSFSMKLPSAARCTQRGDGTTSMIILCMAASRDVLSVITYTYFDQGPVATKENQLKVLQAQASRKLANDKTAPKNDNGIVADLSVHTINDTQVVKATNASGQSVFKSASFFKGPFLIHIVSTPNKNSPKGVDFVKTVIDSVQPKKGEHSFLENAPSDFSQNEQLKALLEKSDDKKESTEKK